MWSMGHIVRNTYFNNLFKVKEFRGRFQIERTIVSNHVHPFSHCHIKLWISSENRKTIAGLKLISFRPTLDLHTVVPWYPREIGLRTTPRPPQISTSMDAQVPYSWPSVSEGSAFDNPGSMDQKLFNLQLVESVYAEPMDMEGQLYQGDNQLMNKKLFKNEPRTNRLCFRNDILLEQHWVS